MRDDERDGENYFFVDDEKFDQMIKAGEFLEHASVFGRRYGSSRQEVDSRRAAGQDVILEIDWQGADQVRALVARRHQHFYSAANDGGTRTATARRGQDSEQAITTRLAEAKTDMSQASRYDYLIVNDDFDQAHEELMSIIRASRQLRQRQVQTAVLPP